MKPPATISVLAGTVLIRVFPVAAEESLAYRWKSTNMEMSVDFFCESDEMHVRVRDPERAAAGEAYPVDVRTAVSYSPVLGMERDLRFAYRERFSGDGIDLGNAPVFLRDLRALHLQEISNRKMLGTEYQRAIDGCGEKPTAEGRDRCFEVLTPGAYLAALGPHPAITIDVIHHSDAAPEDRHAVRFLAAFDSGELFGSLERLACYGNERRP